MSQQSVSTYTHRAGLLTPGSKRYSSRLPIPSGETMFHLEQWLALLCTQHTYSEYAHKKISCSPVTVARLCRHCTDFPILPCRYALRRTHRPPDVQQLHLTVTMIVYKVTPIVSTNMSRRNRAIAPYPARTLHQKALSRCLMRLTSSVFERRSSSVKSSPLVGIASM